MVSFALGRLLAQVQGIRVRLVSSCIIWAWIFQAYPWIAAFLLGTPHLGSAQLASPDAFPATAISFRSVLLFPFYILHLVSLLSVCCGSSFGCRWVGLADSVTAVLLFCSVGLALAAIATPSVLGLMNPFEGELGKR